jgi:hypothetical protein
VSGEVKSVIDKINQSGKYVVSVDIPSGLNGDSGLGYSVISDLTVSVGTIKTGLIQNEAKDKIKRIALQSAQGTHNMDMDSYKKVLIAGIVFTVFSNTDSYANPIDKRIPFRNNILHRGMMDYSDEEAKSVYELLVYFIAELAIMATD